LGIVASSESRDHAADAAKIRVDVLYEFIQLEPGLESKYLPTSEKDAEHAGRLIDALRDVAQLAAHYGRYSESLMYYDRVIKLHNAVQSDRTDMLLDILVEIGDVHMLRGSTKEANEVHHRILTEYSKNSHPAIPYATDCIDFVTPAKSSSMQGTTPRAMLFEAYSQWAQGRREIATRRCTEVVSNISIVSQCDRGSSEEDFLYGFIARYFLADMSFLQDRTDYANEILKGVKENAHMIPESLRWILPLCDVILGAMSHHICSDDVTATLDAVALIMGKAHPLYHTLTLVLLSTTPVSQRRRQLVAQVIEDAEQSIVKTHPLLSHLYEAAAAEWFSGQCYTEAQILFFKALQADKGKPTTVRSHRLRERLCATCSLTNYSVCDKNHVSRTLLPFYHGYLEVCRNTFGPYDIETIPAMIDYAEMLYFLEHYDEALDLLVKALRIADTRNLLFILGGLFKPSVELNRANALERNRLATELYGGEVEEALTCSLLLAQMALVHEALGSFDEAQNYNDQAIACFEIANSATHSGKIVTLDNLARVLVTKGRFGEALSILDQCITLLEDHYAKDKSALQRIVTHRRMVTDLMEQRGYILDLHVWAPVGNHYPVYI